MVTLSGVTPATVTELKVNSKSNLALEPLRLTNTNLIPYNSVFMNM